MVSDVALLGFLHSEELHGYEIYQRFSKLPGLWEIWRIKQSRLYAMLARLEVKGLIQADTIYQENRPARKVFRITENGENAYQTWLVQPVENGRRFRLDFLVKLFFAIQAGETFKTQLIQAQMDTCRDWLQEEQQNLQDYAGQQSFERAIHDFRIGQVLAMLEWLDTVQEMDFVPFNL